MYEYKNFREQIFTEEGQRNFLKVRDHVKKLLAMAGCFTIDKAISVLSGDSWQNMAYVDRLIELGEIHEISKNNMYGVRIFG